MSRFFSLFALTTLCLTACGDKEPVDSGPDIEAGAVVYTASCGGCHGATGAGESESGFTGASDLSVEVATMTDDEIIDLLGSGQGSMPPVSLSETDQEDLLAYLRSEFGG